MPHIPKNDQGGEVTPAKGGQAAGKKIGIGRISLKDWEVDPAEVYKDLYGKEAVNEHGRLVHPRGT